eukprot:PhF_6_TR43410/c0_g1_i1/m.66682
MVDNYCSFNAIVSTWNYTIEIVCVGDGVHITCGDDQMYCFSVPKVPREGNISRGHVHFRGCSVRGSFLQVLANDIDVTLEHCSVQGSGFGATLQRVSRSAMFEYNGGGSTSAILPVVRVFHSTFLDHNVSSSLSCVDLRVHDEGPIRPFVMKLRIILANVTISRCSAQVGSALGIGTKMVSDGFAEVTWIHISAEDLSLIDVESRRGTGAGIFQHSSAVSNYTRVIIDNAASFLDGGAAYLSGHNIVINLSIANSISYKYGGALSILTADTELINNFTNVQITNCSARYGGGAMLVIGDVRVFDWRIKNASTQRNGGAIYVETKGRVFAHGLYMEDTFAKSYGGAVFAWGGIWLYDVWIHNSYAGAVGGAFYLDFSYAVIRGLTVVNSTSDSHGGVFAFLQGHSEVEVVSIASSRSNNGMGGVAFVSNASYVAFSCRDGVRGSISGTSVNSLGGCIGVNVHPLFRASLSISKCNFSQCDSCVGYANQNSNLVAYGSVLSVIDSYSQVQSWDTNNYSCSPNSQQPPLQIMNRTMLRSPCTTVTQWDYKPLTNITCEMAFDPVRTPMPRNVAMSNKKNTSSGMTGFQVAIRGTELLSLITNSVQIGLLSQTMNSLLHSPCWNQDEVEDNLQFAQTFAPVFSLAGAFPALFEGVTSVNVEADIAVGNCISILCFVLIHMVVAQIWLRLNHNTTTRASLYKLNFPKLSINYCVLLLLPVLASCGAAPSVGTPLFVIMLATLAVLHVAGVRLEGMKFKSNDLLLSGGGSGWPRFVLPHGLWKESCASPFYEEYMGHDMDKMERRIAVHGLFWLIVGLEIGVSLLSFLSRSQIEQACTAMLSVFIVLFFSLGMYFLFRYPLTLRTLCVCRALRYLCLSVMTIGMLPALQEDTLVTFVSTIHIILGYTEFVAIAVSVVMTTFMERSHPNVVNEDNSPILDGEDGQELSEKMIPANSTVNGCDL